MHRGLIHTIAAFCLVGAVIYLALDLIPSRPIVREPAEDLRLGKEALVNYFSLMSAGRYEEAAGYHGSGYEVLQDHNPAIDPADHAALLESGCRDGGDRCLEIGAVRGEKVLADGRFLFRVEFRNEDGTTFERGPCCGAEVGPIEREFDFVVERRGSKYLVLTPPVYVP